MPRLLSLAMAATKRSRSPAVSVTAFLRMRTIKGVVPRTCPVPVSVTWTAASPSRVLGRWNLPAIWKPTGVPSTGRVSCSSACPGPGTAGKKTTCPPCETFWLRSRTATGPIAPVGSDSRIWAGTGAHPTYRAAGFELLLSVTCVLTRRPPLDSLTRCRQRSNGGRHDPDILITARTPRSRPIGPSGHIAGPCGPRSLDVGQPPGEPPAPDPVPVHAGTADVRRMPAGGDTMRHQPVPSWHAEGRPLPLTAAPIHVPDGVLADLQQRLALTRWPEDAGNEDWYYGVHGGYLRELVGYWRSGYDWRVAEAAINAYEHYRVQVDGVPVHFMRKAGVGPNPTPLILTHGWPWTFWHWSKVIDPLAVPGAHGGDPAEAFDVIVPSFPGFGFSTPLPNNPDMNFWKLADLWHTLMTQTLGYDKYAAAGCDVGALVTGQLGHKYAQELYAIHIGSGQKLTYPWIPSHDR